MEGQGLCRRIDLDFFFLLLYVLYSASMKNIGLDFSTSLILHICNKLPPSMVAGSVLGGQQPAFYSDVLMSRATSPYEIKIISFNFSSSPEWQLKLEFMRLRGKEGIWSFHSAKKLIKKKGKLLQY